jgi:hypothetical protein
MSNYDRVWRETRNIQIRLASSSSTLKTNDNDMPKEKNSRFEALFVGYTCRRIHFGRDGPKNGTADYHCKNVISL